MSDEDIEMILIDWVHFGSNKHILQPKSVVEGFTMRASYGKNKRATRTCTLTKQLKNFPGALPHHPPVALSPRVCVCALSGRFRVR